MFSRPDPGKIAVRCLDQFTSILQYGLLKDTETLCTSPGATYRIMEYITKCAHILALLVADAAGETTEAPSDILIRRLT